MRMMKGTEIGLCFIISIELVGLIAGESLLAQPYDPCTEAIATMFPCLPFAEGEAATPSAGCCTALSGVLLSHPECFCVILNGGVAGVPINKTLALQLPNACKVKAPPVSDCTKASGNGSDISPSPTSTPTATIPTPPPGRGNDRAPSPSKSRGNTTTIMTCLQLVAFLFVLISFRRD